MIAPSSNRERKKMPLQDLRLNPFGNVTLTLTDAAFKNNNSMLADTDTDTDIDANADADDVSPGRSSSIAAPPSDLNMSIGARAAVYQHTRHISKYGLDGIPTRLSPDNKMQNHRLHDASYEWDRLMDCTHDNTSIIESTVSQSHASLSFTRKYASSVLDDTDVGNDHETTDWDQSDYFNSSRVLNLGTPEKNRPIVDDASRMARLGLGGDVQKRRNESSNSFANMSRSTSVVDLEQSGMIGLFNAAMAMGEMNINEDEEPGHERYTTESFISYHEPNLSVVNLNEGLTQKSLLKNGLYSFHDEHENYQSDIEVQENGSIHIDGDIQEASFISYREPNLSMVDAREGNQIQSEFDVDVSGIYAPSEFESKVPYPASPFGKSSIARLEGSPEGSISDRRSFASGTSPVVRSPSMAHSRMFSAEVEARSDFEVSSNISYGVALSTTSFARDDEEYEVHLLDANSTYTEGVSANSETPPHKVRPSESSSPGNSKTLFPLKEYIQNPVDFKENLSVLSPIDHSSSVGKKRGEANSTVSSGIKLNSRTIKTNHFGLLSPLSPPTPIDEINEKTTTRSKSIPSVKSSRSVISNIGRAVNNGKNHCPQRMSLRDRYSRPDRFEDSYSVPSSTSTIQSSPQINRSLLKTFENDCNKPPRRFAV